MLAYLLGSVSTAVITSRALGLPDPRQVGSKNPGATNVLRVGGKKAAIITLIGDILKGAIPILVARGAEVSPVIVAMVGLAAFLGHLFPVFFRFRGGKGVATAFGVLLAISPLAGGALAGTWVLVALVSRYSSLAALSAAVAAPFFVVVTTPVGRWSFFVMTLVISLLLLWRHRPNIQNLRQGTETKIGSKAGIVH